MKILGIDNGLDGGLVLMDGNSPRERFVMPTVKIKDGKREYDISVLLRKIQQLQPDHAFIEKAQAMPMQGGVSMFRIGDGYGLIRGMISALSVPFTLVHPKTWQGGLFCLKPTLRP